MNQTTNKIIFVPYVRNSSEDVGRQVASLGEKEKVLMELAKRYGLKTAEAMREAHSAKTANMRPVFSEMVRKIKSGSDFGILCWKLDRLARNPEEAGIILGMLQRGEIKCIKTPHRDYYPEESSLLSFVEFGMANQYSRDLSNNVKRGLHEKAKRGLFPCFAPLGYLNNPLDPKGMKKIIKDPVRFEQVRKIFDFILHDHLTPVQVWRIAKEEWKMTTSQTKSVGRPTIYRMLTSPVYAGIFEYPVGSGEWHKGTHEPIITLEEYDNIQIILGKKGKPRQQKHIFSFTGVIRCGGCGGMITAQHATKRQKNGNIHRYIYYRCTKKINPNCSEKCVEESKLKEQIGKITKRINIPAGFHAWGLEKIKRDIYQEERFTDKVMENKQKQGEGIAKQLSKLLDLLTREVISEEAYQSKYAELNKDKVRLNAAQVNSEDIIQELISKGEEYFDLARDGANEIENGSPEKRRRVVSTLGSNPSLKGRIFSICTKKVLQVFEELSREVNDIHSKLKPPKSGKNVRDLELAYAQNPAVRRGWDLNPRDHLRSRRLATCRFKPLSHLSQLNLSLS